METVYEQDAPSTKSKNGRMFKRTLDISWGAIFAGWLVAAAAALALYALGAATGISTIRPTDLDSISPRMVISAAVWLIVTWVVALSLGGYFAGAITRTTDKRAGGLQGIAVWALSNILTIFVGAVGLGVVGLAGLGVAGANGQVMGGGLVEVASPADQEKSKNPANFQAELKERIIPKIDGELKAETVALMASQFIQGDKESAKNSLLLNTSLTAEEADGVVNELSQKTLEAKAKVKTIADNTASYTATGLWLSVLVSLLSLIGAFFGGKAGVRDYIEKSYNRNHKADAVEVKF